MDTYKNHSDDALLLLIQEDSEGALKEVVCRYWHKLHVQAQSRVRDTEVAKEIVQETFISLWEKRHTSWIKNLGAYLFSCVKNKSLNYIEAAVVRQKYWEYYKNFIGSRAQEEPDPVEYVSLLEAIDQGLDMLPKKSKQVFKLSRLEGRTIPEIASILNLSEKAIEYHLSKSLKMLRLHLKDFIAVFLSLFLNG